MKIKRYNELLMSKSIIEDMVGYKYRNKKFTIEDMYKAYFEGHMSCMNGEIKYDFPEWIKKNY